MGLSTVCVSEKRIRFDEPYVSRQLLGLDSIDIHARRIGECCTNCNSGVYSQVTHSDVRIFVGTKLTHMPEGYMPPLFYDRRGSAEGFARWWDLFVGGN